MTLARTGSLMSTPRDGDRALEKFLAGTAR
jgi:hypothetical protein